MQRRWLGSKSHSSESCSESGENDDNQSGRHHRHHGWKHSRGGTKPRIQNSPTCRMELIETVPEVLVKKHLVASSLPVQHSSTIRSWMKLVDLAKDKVEIITQWGIYNSTGYGLKFYEKLEKAASEDGIRIKIGYNPRVMNDTNVTPRDLRREAPRKVEERMLDIWGMVDGNSGVIHSKMILTDRSHFYIGSANLGNRGTTKTKEVGIMIRDCQLLGEDAGKIFDTYWSVYGMKSLPDSWPSKLSTTINHQTPLRVYNPLDDHLYDVFLSAGPRPMNAVGRSEDLEAILWAMDRASKYIYIAVNEYLPMDVYKKNHYWPVIDERIRAAVKRNVVVKFLMNDLATHKDQMRPFLQKKFYGVWGQDLLKLNTRSKKFIEVRMFKANVKKFHGSHNKFMVTDKSGFIGTSNWTEDYFTTTAGQGFVFEPISESSNHDRDRSETDESRSRFNLRDQLEQIFHRDWTSKMAYPFK